MSRGGGQCRVRKSRRSLHNRALSRTRAHCGCPRKDRHKRIVGLSECDACRRHSPLRFASNGDVGTPVSKCSLKEDYWIPALAQRTFILVRMSHRQSGQNQWLRCPVGVCAVKRRRFPVGASPARQPLQPEATGAVMEAPLFSEWPLGTIKSKLTSAVSVLPIETLRRPLCSS